MFPIAWISTKEYVINVRSALYCKKRVVSFLFLIAKFMTWIPDSVLNASWISFFKTNPVSPKLWIANNKTMSYVFNATKNSSWLKINAFLWINMTLIAKFTPICYAFYVNFLGLFLMENASIQTNPVQPHSNKVHLLYYHLKLL